MSFMKKVNIMNKRLGIHRGFTMVELVLVVGVLVVLSAVVLVTMQVPKYRGQAHNVQRKTDVRSMHNAFLLMARDKDDYTTGLPTSPTCIGTGSSSPFNLKGISWTVNPSDTAMKFNVRACADSTCSTNPLWGSDYSSPTSFDIPNASFFQYKATFNNVSDSAWTQGASGDPFNGTINSTDVSGGSVNLAVSFDNGTGVDQARVYCASAGTFDGSTCTHIGASQTLPTQATPFNFTDFKIGSGVTVTVNGANPLQIKATGNVTIASTGILSLNGGNGGSASGGVDGSAGIGVAGGVNGGSGNPGVGSGAGPGGIGGGGMGGGCTGENCTAKGGGGGGHATTGGIGSGSGSGGAVGSSYGDAALSILYGGSGGGAGGDAGYGGHQGGGGGGGGAIKISIRGAIVVNGTIIANGGGSGSGDFDQGWYDLWTESKNGGPGGGGSGGSIHLMGNSIDVTGGAITATAGGNGSVGRIRLDYATKTGNNPNPVPGYTRCPSGCTTASGLFTSSGTYTSLPQDLLGTQTFTSISWTPTTNIPGDGEITLGDANLKGLWHFNETSGTNAPDSTLINNLTTSGITWSSSSFKFGGRSLLFNGSTSYAQKTSPTNLEIGASDGNWTLEAWVKPAGIAAGTIISKDGVAMHYYDLKLNTNNQVVAGLYDSDGSQAVATSSSALGDANNNGLWDDWHHIVAVFTKSGTTGTVQIYVDGKKDSNLGNNSSLPSSSMSNAADFRIGRRNDNTVGFNGEIDEVAFWSKALTAPATDCAIDEPKISYDSYQYEICQHYNKGIGIPHLKFQARSCNDAVCDTEIFVGPDGTSSTYYNSIGNYGSNSLLNLTANQWVQYKAYLATSDSSITPSLNSISIKYNSSQVNKPKLEDVTITASLDSAGKNQVNLLYSGYGDFYGGGANLGQFDSSKLKILPEGSVEYQGGSAPEYTSPVFSTQCYDIKPILYPEYLPEIPKDPKIGTDENTGYFFSANSEMGTVTISAPAAELGEVIRN